MLARATAVTLSAVVSLAVAGAVDAAPAWADAPSVTGYTPANVVPGAVLHILGSGLAGTTDVAFTGGVDAAPSTVSDTDVAVTVPAGAQSGPVSLTPATSTTPPNLGVETTSITRDAAIVAYPNTTHVRATLTAAGQGISGQSATLLVRAVGATKWSPAPNPQTTSSTGAVAFLVKPMRGTQYEVAFAGSTTAAAVRTAMTTVSFRPLLRASFPAVAPILTTQRFTGSVSPRVAGTVKLQRLIAGVWHLAATTTASSTGAFAFTVSPWKTKGTYTYRVVRPADAQHLKVSTSARKILAVDRTLRSGMSGSDVVYLQKRLQALHYDVPAATGVFNYDTLHAVIAFEKVQRLTRDGVVSPTVWSRLGRPVVPHLLHPLAGVAAVEVDLTRQVLFYAVNGAIVRILDVSSGGGYTYVGSDGQLSKAITPEGHFSIRYKIDRWVTSKLGTLYRPAYFNNSGYAIHGEGEVPSYPASHGCVRITVPAMDRMYSKLTVGMSVWIYHT
jgi:peptidoglycan hydrolase-like protein with peptidoglycan-binding domain